MNSSCVFVSIQSSVLFGHVSLHGHLVRVPSCSLGSLLRIGRCQLKLRASPLSGTDEVFLVRLGIVELRLVGSCMRGEQFHSRLLCDGAELLSSAEMASGKMAVALSHSLLSPAHHNTLSQCFPSSVTLYNHEN